MKEDKVLIPHLDMVLAAGAIWGLSEAILGMWLKQCASSFSGAVMTGIAFLYMSFTWTLTRRALALVLLFIVAGLFKLLDTLLLALPFLHGAVANPLYAFLLEILTFFVLVTIFNKGFSKGLPARMAVGGGAALAATMLFPTVGWFTGIPACLYPGSTVPLSVYTAPVAILLSLATVPAGFYLAGLYTRSLPAMETGLGRLIIRRSWSPLVFILCIVIIILSKTGGS